MVWGKGIDGLCNAQMAIEYPKGKGSAANVAQSSCPILPRATEPRRRTLSNLIAGGTQASLPRRDPGRQRRGHCPARSK